ncbi:MAG: peptidase T, partial [Bacteroidota bacterium]
MYFNQTPSIQERFLQYVQIDTQSDPHSATFPSTEKQKDLGRLLVKELHAIGIKDAELDAYGYVYATIPASSGCEDAPTICFCSHMDTSPDASGKGVKPLVHTNYQGQDLVLPDDPSIVIRQAEHPDLAEQHGNDIITASGTTLLGAVDKAGVAAIMGAAHYLMEHPEVKHGRIRILFTPDEEVGQGVNHVDMAKLGADFGYTMDGARRGSMEDETFSADGARVIIEGVSAHPGYAKGNLENAVKIAAEIIATLPKDRLSPETTADREGFIHPLEIKGIAEQAQIDFIIRDFTGSKGLGCSCIVSTASIVVNHQQPNL